MSSDSNDLSKRLGTVTGSLGSKGAVPTAKEQAAQIFEEELSRAAINALAICVNYERALGTAQIEYDVGQIARREFTDDEIRELQKKENEKAAKEVPPRTPKTLTREYLGARVDRSKAMQDKMAAEKDKQIREMEAQIGYKPQESESEKTKRELIANFEDLAQENPALALEVEKFKKDPSASYLLKLEKKARSENNADLALKIQKIRKAADRAVNKAEDHMAHLERLATENPVLAGRIAAFKRDIADAAQKEFEKVKKEDKAWNSRPPVEKRRILADVTRRVAERRLDELYPNHNTDKYIAEHPQRDQDGRPVYEVVKDKHLNPILGEDGRPKLRLKELRDEHGQVVKVPIPIPAEEVVQRLPGVVAYALNPSDLSVIVRNRREDGMDEPRIRQPVVPQLDPPQPVNNNAPRPKIEIDPSPSAKKKPAVEVDDGMQFLFTRDSMKALQQEKAATIGIEVNMTPERFREICLEELPLHIEETYGDVSNKFKGVVCEADPSGANNSYRISQDNTSLVELVYNTPKGNNKTAKIDIILTDPQQKDESLVLMVASAKKVLEDRRVPRNREKGKWKFNIENCENKPELALKLYLQGLSLGLQPQFKDEHNDNATLQGMLAYEGKKVKYTGDDLSLKEKYEDGELSFKDVYEEAQSGRLKGDELKQYINALAVSEGPEPEHHRSKRR